MHYEFCIKHFVPMGVIQTKAPLKLSSEGLSLDRGRLPTLPLSQYHRRGGVYLLCSEWEEVEPPCYGRLSIVRSSSGLSVRDLYKVRIALEASLRAGFSFFGTYVFTFATFYGLSPEVRGISPL